MEDSEDHSLDGKASRNPPLRCDRLHEVATQHNFLGTPLNHEQQEQGGYEHRRHGIRTGPRHPDLAAGCHASDVNCQNHHCDCHADPDVPGEPAQTQAHHRPLLDEPHPQPQQQPDP